MAVKTINDMAGPDGIISTLLIFSAYPWVAEDLAPAPTLRQYALAIQKATEAIHKLYATCQVSKALAACNSPITSSTMQLLPQSLVRVWREKSGWKGPYKLIATGNEDCTVEINSRHAIFRSTIVKPYYENPATEVAQVENPASETEQTKNL